MEKIVSRSTGNLVKMIKGAGGKFDDHSVSPKNSKNFIVLEL